MKGTLTDRTIRNARPGGKPRKLFDGGGLFLLLNPNGRAGWRLKYRYGGREKQLSLGVYPDVTLAKAREKREELRRLLAEDIDPGEKRKAEKAARGGADSFETVAREWFAKQKQSWAPSHANKVIGRLERDLFPWLGMHPVGAIKAPELLRVLRRVESRGAVETAHRELQIAGRVFRYAVGTGRADADPAPSLRGSLTPWKPEHYAALIDPESAAELLRAIDAYQGAFVTKSALQLLPLVFTRPGELRRAEWAQFDLEAAEWRYFVTKTKTDHIVPLATQAVALLRALEPLTGASRYVFPSPRSDTRPISENTLNAALDSMGYTREKMRAHGFRAMARTLLDESLGFRVDFIEHQLAHNVRDPLGRAYNRTKHLPERRAMMQSWADYLDTLKTDGNVVALRAGPVAK
jgi:integrase